MIIYTEKGRWLGEAIGEAGYWLHNGHNPVPGKDYNIADESAIQAIIDSFDSLPFARKDAINSIKLASVAKRLEYVTDAPGKDAEYKDKEAEADEYYKSTTVGMYMQARMDLTSETALQVADTWNDKGSARMVATSKIGAIEDKARMDLYAETEWQDCAGIAEAAVTAIEAV